MSSRVLPWVLRVVWAAMPFTVGPLLGEALRHHTDAVSVAASVGLWGAWAVVLVATLVPHPIGLTVLRCVAPGAAAVALVGVIVGGPSSLSATVGVAWSVAVAVLTLQPATAVLFVNGPAYPNERRLPLAAPSALLLGPLELAWAAVVGLPAVAVVLMASSQWVVGAVVAVAGAAAVWFLGRALHGLTLRWVVFVPAGLVLHDPMGLVDPVLFVREVVESVGPAPADSTALDLTQGAAGLTVELRLKTVVPLHLVTRGNHEGTAVEADRVLFTPSRPGAMLDEAARRRLPVG